MLRIHLACLLLSGICFHDLPAQSLMDARRLHLPDSGALTAGALDAEGNLYLASTLNLKTTFGQNGILGLFPAGDPVLSKYDSDGALIWRREFPGNFVRICDAAVTPDQGLVITGGYVDTFRLAPDWLIPGVNDYDANFFIARLDADGNFLWVDTAQLSTLPEDCLGWTLALSADAIFVAGMHEAVWSSLRRYDYDGTLRAEKILNIRTISDLALDAEGWLYAVGTADSWAMFGNLPLPTPPTPTGYANFVVRLDSSLAAHWVHATNYITFDEHPKVAVFEGKVFALSNDFDQVTGCYQLKAYSPEGAMLWSDCILPGTIPADYQHFALQPFCDRLLLQYSSAGGMAVKAYDAGFGDTVLVQTSAADFEGSFPFICTNAGRAVFGSNFRNDGLVINGDFTLLNDRTPVYQQFMLEFECPDASSGSETPVAAVPRWCLAPNPAAAVVHLSRPTAGLPDEVVRVDLFDAAGHLHWQGSMCAEHLAVSLETLPLGLYYLRVMSGEGVVVLKGMRG